MAIAPQFFRVGSIRSNTTPLTARIVATSRTIGPTDSIEFRGTDMQLAKETGLTREGLYKALSKDGNPSLGTVLKVLKALGLKFTPQVV